MKVQRKEEEFPGKFFRKIYIERKIAPPLLPNFHNCSARYNMSRKSALRQNKKKVKEREEQLKVKF